MELSPPLQAQLCAGTTPPCVLTAQYDNNRDGYNPYETKITPTNLFRNGLTLLAPLLVDTPPSTLPPSWMTYNTNLIYAQPLFVAGITVNPNAPGSPGNCTSTAGPHTCNMLVAETLYGSVWAWNADTGKVIFSRTGTGGTNGQNVLWYDDCFPDGAIPYNTQGGVGSLPFAGIVSTPVIDPTIAVPGTGLYGVMFLTSLCRNTASRSAAWYLHELDLTNGLLDVSGSN